MVIWIFEKTVLRQIPMIPCFSMQLCCGDIFLSIRNKKCGKKCLYESFCLRHTNSAVKTAGKKRTDFVYVLHQMCKILFPVDFTEKHIYIVREGISMATNRTAVPEAKAALEQFKYEVASEIGVPLKKGYNGDLTSAQNGYVGGYMGKKMIYAQEKQMAGK